MKELIKGCGKLIDGVICCGEHIDMERDDENGIPLLHPVLCSECWKIQRDEVIIVRDF